MLTAPISATIGSIKVFGEVEWRAADKAEPVKNQDWRDYTTTKAVLHVVIVIWQAPVSVQIVCVAYVSASRLLQYCAVSSCGAVMVG